MAKEKFERNKPQRLKKKPVVSPFRPLTLSMRLIIVTMRTLIAPATPTM